MFHPQTIKVKNDTELGYRIINEDDFNPDLHIKFEIEEDKVILPKTRKAKV